MKNIDVRTMAGVKTMNSKNFDKAQGNRMVPLRKRLSYFWEKVAFSETLYSPVYAQDRVIPVNNENYSICATSYLWMKATPLVAEPGRYTLRQFEYLRHQMNHAVHGNRNCIETVLPRGAKTIVSFSRDEVLQIMVHYGQVWQSVGFKQTPDQPFSGKTAPGIDGPSLDI